MRQWTVDAFASAPFKGNPACVVEPFEAWPHDVWMAALAAENNQAETAFLLRTDDPARFGLRWRTPTLEVPLCGHATLASAHILMTEFGAAAAITFDTLSGPLSVSQADGGLDMDFPADPPHRVEAPAGLAEALGAKPVEVWAGQYLVAIMADQAAVLELDPDLGALKRIGAEASRGPGKLSVAAVSDAGSDYDVVTRFFGSGAGIPEDPATGSAVCALAPLFAGKLNKSRIRVRQAYPGRGADLEGEIRGDRVLLRGRAITVIESRLLV